MSTTARIAEHGVGRSGLNALGLVILLCAVGLLGGCGGGEDGGRSTQTGTGGDMVPAGYGTTAADTMIVAAGEEPAEMTTGETMTEAEGWPEESAVQTQSGMAAGSSATGDADHPAAAEPDHPTTAEVTMESAGGGEARRVEPPVSADQGLGPYWLHLGSFTNPDNAQRRLEQVRGVGVSAMLTVATVDGVTYHRVCVPNLPDMDAAYDLGERLRGELDIKYLVWKD